MSGLVQGDMHLCDRKSGDNIISELGSKKLRVSHLPLEDLVIANKVVRETELAERLRYAIPSELIKEIFRLGMTIENHVGSPQDIELVVSGNDIIIVQSRPITCLKNKK